MNQVIKVTDYIGDPSQRCEKHGQSFYFHCWQCFTSRDGQRPSFLFGGPGGPSGAGQALPDSTGEEEFPR
jgi:hypothetical protein